VQARRLQLLGQLRTGQGLRQRLAKGSDQAPALVRQRRAVSALQADQQQRPLLRTQRPPPPMAGGQGIGAEARRLLVLPGPVGGRALGVGQLDVQAPFMAPLPISAARQQGQLHACPAAQLLLGHGQHGLTVGGDGELARQLEQRRGLALRLTQHLHLAPLAAGQVTGQAGHEQEEQQGQHVLLTLDLHGQGRRNEQEVVGQERQPRARQRRPQAAAHRHQQHGSEEHQGDVRQLQHPRQAEGDQRGAGSCQCGQQVVTPARRDTRAPTSLWLITRRIQHAHLQPGPGGQQTLAEAATEPASAQTPRAAADQNEAGAAFAGVVEQRARHRVAMQRHHLAAKALGQAQRGLQTAALFLVHGPAAVHMHHRPGQMTALGHPAGVAYQALGLAVAVNPHQQASEHAGRGLAELAIALVKVGIDPRGGSLHGQLAQRGEVGRREKGVDGRTRLLGHVHLAIAQAFEQLARRQVDQLDLVGFLQHPVRHRLAHLHASDIAHAVIEAFQVLHVDRGVDVDTGSEQLLHILPALGVAAAGGVAVRQLVDQRQFGRVGEQTVEVHLAEFQTAIRQAQRWLLWQPQQQRLGLAAAVTFHHPGAQQHALAQLCVSSLEHGVGLAHARRRAEEHLEPATSLAGQVGEQRFGAQAVVHGNPVIES